MTKPRGKYQGVSLPVPFIQEIKTHIMKDNKYKSIAEFIRDACREKMKKDSYPFLRKEQKTYFKSNFDRYIEDVFDRKFKEEINKSLKNKNEKKDKNGFRG